MPDENRKLVMSSRAPGQMSDLYDDRMAPERYEDGVGQMMLGASVTKIGFFKTEEFSTDENGNMIEHRVLDNKIIMPTTQLIEWAAGVLTSVLANRELLTAANASTENAINGVIEAMSSTAKR